MRSVVVRFLASTAVGIAGPTGGEVQYRDEATRRMSRSDPEPYPGPPTDRFGKIIRFCGGAGSRTCPANDQKTKRRADLHGHYGDLAFSRGAGEGGWERVRSGESGSSGRQVGDKTSARFLARFRRQASYRFRPFPSPRLGDSGRQGWLGKNIRFLAPSHAMRVGHFGTDLSFGFPCLLSTALRLMYVRR